MSATQKTLILVLAAISLWVACRNQGVGYDPRYDAPPAMAAVVPPQDPHEGHKGGPGCDSFWAYQGAPVDPWQRDLAERVGKAGSPGKPGSLLRVVTLNIHHAEPTTGGGPNLDLLAVFLGSLSPDVVVLQEIDKGTTRAAGADQARALADLLGFPGVAFGSAMSWDGGSYGEAILSRWPIEASESHQLPRAGGLEPRQALAARIGPDGGLPSFVVLGTHLDHLSPEWRTIQAAEVNRIAQGSEAPLILAGDFNAPREEPSVGGLLTRWIDAGDLDSRIDHVMVRPGDGWKVAGTEAVRSPNWDHPAVVVDLGWTGR